MKKVIDETKKASSVLKAYLGAHVDFNTFLTKTNKKKKLEPLKLSV